MKNRFPNLHININQVCDALIFFIIIVHKKICCTFAITQVRIQNKMLKNHRKYVYVSKHVEK